MPKSQLETTDLPFKTFPEFSKLTLNDRKKYERTLAKYPPYIDTSFPMLMTWWSALDRPRIAMLNNNIIISYFMPGIEDYSGLSLVGMHEVDRTICEIFDFQQGEGETARLRHVPEFVIKNILHPQLFTFEEERHLDEYVATVESLYPLKNLPKEKQIKVKKRLDSAVDRGFSMRSLDLDVHENRDMLIDAMYKWPLKGFNKLTAWEFHSQVDAIQNASSLGYDNLCVFVADELKAFVLYQLPASDRRYAFMTYIGVADEYVEQYEFIMHLAASWFAEKGARYINIDSDLGMSCFRTRKLTLGPVNYARKYTITPSKLMSLE